jgi:hypothetical protein
VATPQSDGLNAHAMSVSYHRMSVLYHRQVDQLRETDRMLRQNITDPSNGAGIPLIGTVTRELAIGFLGCAKTNKAGLTAIALNNGRKLAGVIAQTRTMGTPN